VCKSLEKKASHWPLEGVTSRRSTATPMLGDPSIWERIMDVSNINTGISSLTAALKDKVCRVSSCGPTNDTHEQAESTGFAFDVK
jgi:hypothetical protein